MARRIFASMVLLVLLSPQLVRAQRPAATQAPPAVFWRHELRIEGHLALSYSPDGAFSPDGSTLAVVEQRRVFLVSLKNGSVVKITPELPHIAELQIQSANYVSPDQLFILASGVIKTNRGSPVPELAFQWNISGNKLASKIESLGGQGGFLPVRYFPRIGYAALYKDSTFTLWNPVTGRAGSVTIPKLKHSPLVFAFSPDGHWLLLAQIETNATPNPVVVELKQRSFVNVLAGHHGAVLSMTFSRDGKMLETSSVDGKVRLWSVPAWNLVQTLTGNLGPVHWAEFSPDGSLVASAGEDRTVRVWDVKTGALIETLSESRQPLLTVAFSPDGRYLAATSQHEVHAWVRTSP